MSAAIKAKKSHDPYLESEREKIRSREEQKKMEASKLFEEEQTIALIRSEKVNINTLEKNIQSHEKQLSDNQKLTGAMFAEASKKLDVYIDKEDLVGVKIAKSLLLAATESKQRKKPSRENKQIKTQALYTLK